MGKDSAARIELGRSFHQMGTVNENVCESDFIYPALSLYMLLPWKDLSLYYGNYFTIVVCLFVFSK